MDIPSRERERESFALENLSLRRKCALWRCALRRARLIACEPFTPHIHSNHKDWFAHLELVKARDVHVKNFPSLGDSAQCWPFTGIAPQNNQTDSTAKTIRSQMVVIFTHDF